MSFLPCTWAKDYADGSRFCNSPAMIRQGVQVSEATCAKCSLRNHAPPKEEPKPETKATGRRTATCIHLGEPTGETVACQSCRGDVKLKLFSCKIHGICTTAKKVEGHASCPECTDYSPGHQSERLTKRQAEAKRRAALPKPEARPANRSQGPVIGSLPGDPRCGVVVGSFSQWPHLIELQLRTIRQSCGEVPVLVSEDSGPHRSEVISICRRYDADYVDAGRIYPEQQIVERIGHTGGDMAALYHGLIWAHRKGIEVLGKLSQRFIVTKRRWLQTGAIDLMASGSGLATQAARGITQWPVRTEAMLLLVRGWVANPVVMQWLVPRPRFAPDTAEKLIDRIYRDHVCSFFLPWSLLSEERAEPRDGCLWHYANTAEEYADLAESLGIPWGEFSANGWNAIAGPYKR